MSDPVLRLTARPAQVYVGRYERLPHPALDTVQEFVVDITLRATAAIVLTDVVWRVFDANDRVIAVRQRLGREAMHELTRGQYGVAPGLDLTLHRCYFLEQGSLPLSRLSISAAGYEYQTKRAVTASLEVPLLYHTQHARLHLPVAEGSWWAITGHDWTATHKADPVSWAFAYDFVRLGPDGQIFSGRGLHNEDHHSFGQPVVAPASGKVVFVRDDMPDQPPGQPPDPAWLADDLTRVAGNVVVIAHGHGEFSYLAHLQSGSIQVQPGDVVKRGQQVAAVGNSGQSPGPHLHYHLQDGPHLFVDQGLPVLFSHFVATGDVVEQAHIPSRMIVSPT